MPTASTTKVFTIGLTKLEAAHVQANGAKPSSGWEQHGNVYRDTLTLETSDPTVENYYEEELDKPVASQGTEGETTLAFEILRPSVADLVFWAGGSADDVTSGDGRVWNAPIGYVDKKLALKLTSKQGYIIEIPKAQIVASTTGGGSKSTPMRLKVSATVLVPSNEQGVDQTPMVYTAPASA